MNDKRTLLLSSTSHVQAKMKILPTTYAVNRLKITASLCHFIGKNQNTYKQNLLCIWFIFYLSIQTKSIVGGIFECAY